MPRRGGLFASWTGRLAASFSGITRVRTSALPPLAREQPAARPMRVLVIEDDRETAQFLQRSLRESGHTADVAGDGESGLAMAREGRYDVLIVDRMLPRRDGLSVVQTLRARGRAHAGPHPLRARRGRRPRQGPARRRRRLPHQALRLHRAARPHRGAGAPAARPRSRPPATSSASSRSTASPTRSRAPASPSCCSRASSGCSST